MKHELSKPIALLKHVVSGMLRVFNLSELHRTERGYKPMYLASGLGLYSMGKRAITANEWLSALQLLIADYYRIN